ncbi:MAG: UDP-N-acetylmuramate--L-alanine ligase [Pelagibacteraceae bacterium]|nr:UDP-N-acetylmuramate--L-alanine ligase [Pelagibacteraceae bacterium]|tara:strand:+ start:2334 stop:3719 length:1386 start_codon:yes stop_codon:yes gene_type:complete
MFKKVKSIHFIGIGGIGMSGIAELLNNLGFKITGSDLIASENVVRLESLGINISIGHDLNNLGGADAVVYSSAVPLDNPEILSAIDRSIPVIRRAEMLGELINLKRTSIAVGGTHGKTTTSSMIGMILEKSGYDPTLVVGGLVSNLNTNVKLGSGELIVVEADEYDRSFLALNPTIAIVTNLEMEHTDCYKDINDIEDAFLQFCKSVPFYGTVILCADSDSLMRIMPKIKKPTTTYGLSDNADYRAKNIEYARNKSKYSLFHKNKDLGEIKINVPGKHNVLNSLASIALGLEIDTPLELLKKGINSYTGVRRRFEIKKNKTDILVVDDYAHHPTEVKATINAAKNGWNKRIVSVFQPHLFSRTRDFFKEFAESLFKSDLIIITEIYPAREKPIDSISSKLIINELNHLGHNNTHHLKDLNDLNNILEQLVQPKDMVITMGAGDIWRFSDKYNEYLIENYGN